MISYRVSDMLAPRSVAFLFSCDAHGLVASRSRHAPRARAARYRNSAAKWEVVRHACEQETARKPRERGLQNELNWAQTELAASRSSKIERKPRLGLPDWTNLVRTYASTSFF